MHIEHIIENHNGYFRIIAGSTEAGRISYSSTGSGIIIIDHTEVNPDFKGKGIGKLLVFEIVKFARENSIKIIPLCTFAKSVFDKEVEFRDVLR